MYVIWTAVTTKFTVRTHSRLDCRSPEYASYVCNVQEIGKMQYYSYSLIGVH